LTTLTKIMFFHYDLSICEKSVQDIRNYFNWQLLGKLVWALQQQKLDLQLDPSYGDSKIWKVMKNLICHFPFFHFRLIEHCCDVFPINNFFQWQMITSTTCSTNKQLAHNENSTLPAPDMSTRITQQCDSIYSTGVGAF